MDPRIQVISEVSETGQQKLGQLNLRDPQQNWDRLELVIKGKKNNKKIYMDYLLTCHIMY